MITSDQLCLGCMSPREAGEVCPRCGYQHDAAPTSPLYFKPGGVLHDQYIVGRILGHGGFGLTYLGYDTVLDRKIAIKEYLPGSIATRQVETAQVTAHHEKMRGDFEFGLQRFIEEARTLARFQGFPNIIGVMNLFSANGTAYMVMEYLAGETLEAHLERNGGRISYAAALEILMPVMKALDEVHRQGILHRDVSPDNIFLVKGGPVKLLDFGAARNAMRMRSQTFSVILREGYAPEEQYSSKGEQGPWTDVYALAGTMYRALTGQIPTPALERRASGELIPPSRLGSDIPPEAESVLMRALAVDAADRYRSIDEFRSALLSPGSVVTAAPQMQLPHSPDRSPRGRLVPLLACGAVLLAALSYATWRAVTMRPAEVAFSAAEATIAQGQRTTINWDVHHARSVEIEGIGPVPSKGSAAVTLRETTTYRLVAKGGNGKPVEKSVQIQVIPMTAPVAEPKPSPLAPPPKGQQTLPGQPRIAFTASPPVIRPGELATLQWALENAISGQIEPSVGDLPRTSGQLTVRPAASTTYVLTARASDGATATSSVTVQVTGTPAPVPSTGPAPALQAADASKGQFVVFHEHGVNVAGRSVGGYCAGILEVVGGHVIYRVSQATDQHRHDFDQPVAMIAESRQNRFGFLGRPAFHLRFLNGQNYNLAPQNTTVAHVLRVLAESK
jgi:serine/threonine protein kinase